MIIIDSRRVKCTMRNKWGNCLPCGGFCTSVSTEICNAMQNAYEHGYRARVEEERRENDVQPDT